MRATTIFPNTGRRHLSSRCSTESIPAKRKATVALVITIVTVVKTLSSHRVFKDPVNRAHCETDKTRMRNLSLELLKNIKQIEKTKTEHNRAQYISVWQKPKQNNNSDHLHITEGLE